MGRYGEIKQKGCGIMAITVKIEAESNTKEEMVEILKKTAVQVGQGYTSISVRNKDLNYTYKVIGDES